MKSKHFAENRTTLPPLDHVLYVLQGHTWKVKERQTGQLSNSNSTLLSNKRPQSLLQVAKTQNLYDER